MMDKQRTLEIYFAGSGMDGEARYELRGLTAEMTILTRDQLYEELRNEAGISEQMISQHRHQIEGLSTAMIVDGSRPAVILRN